MKIKESLVYHNTVAELVLIQFRNTRELKMKRKMNTSKNRITSMIIFNGLNFILFKLPLAIYSLHGFIVRMNDSKSYSPSLIWYIVCRTYKFFESLEEFCFLIYLNSFTVQFFILFKLDKNFNEAFKLIRKKIEAKFS